MVDRTDISRVLVADDNAVVAQRVCELLRDAGGIEVIGPARDGAEALALMEHTAPHGAVLDIDMPLVNGIEVLRAIRASKRRCFVVMLTGHREPSIRDLCLAEGADHFLEKATDFDRLVDIVRTYAVRAR